MAELVYETTYDGVCTLCAIGGRLVRMRLSREPLEYAFPHGQVLQLCTWCVLHSLSMVLDEREIPLRVPEQDRANFGTMIVTSKDARQYLRDRMEPEVGELEVGVDVAITFGGRFSEAMVRQAPEEAEALASFLQLDLRARQRQIAAEAEARRPTWVVTDSQGFAVVAACNNGADIVQVFEAPPESGTHVTPIAWVRRVFEAQPGVFEQIYQRTPVSAVPGLEERLQRIRLSMWNSAVRWFPFRDPGGSPSEIRDEIEADEARRRGFDLNAEEAAMDRRAGLFRERSDEDRRVDREFLFDDEDDEDGPPF